MRFDWKKLAAGLAGIAGPTGLWFTTGLDKMYPSATPVVCFVVAVVALAANVRADSAQ